MDGLVQKDLKKISSEYARLMVREVLGMELNDMGIEERYRAITYSWLSFNSRSQLFEDKGGNTTKGVKIEHDWVTVFERENYTQGFLNQIQSEINVKGK